MRHEGRVLDQTFDPAEALGQREQPAALEEASGAVERAFKLDRDHAAERAHLRSGERVLRMALQARIEHAPHFRMGFEPTRNLEPRTRVPLRAPGERLAAAT